MIDDDESPYPTQDELNAEDAQYFYRIIAKVRESFPESRLAGEDPADWVIRVLDCLSRKLAAIRVVAETKMQQEGQCWNTIHGRQLLRILDGDS